MVNMCVMGVILDQVVLNLRGDKDPNKIGFFKCESCGGVYSAFLFFGFSRNCPFCHCSTVGRCYPYGGGS